MRKKLPVLIKLVLILTGFFSLSACSIFSSHEVTPETRQAVLTICDEYLRDLAGGKSRQAEAMIAWSDYRPATKDELSREEFNEIIKSKKDLWSREEHPLLGLEVLSVQIDSDSATVELKKKSTNQKVEVKLSWVGRGWLVISDNVLSKDGIFRK